MCRAGVSKFISPRTAPTLEKQVEVYYTLDIQIKKT